jgi:hypothetical protein
MRATHPDPRILLAALVATFLMAFAAAAPHQLGDIHPFSSSGGAAPAASAPAAQPAGTPAWVKDPMASPLDELRAP